MMGTIPAISPSTHNNHNPQIPSLWIMPEYNCGESMEVNIIKMDKPPIHKGVFFLVLNIFAHFDEKVKYDNNISSIK
jgi:hypothetical protein